MQVHGRSKARELALQYLYSASFMDVDVNVQLHDKLARSYIINTLEQKEQIDSLIKPYLRKWSLAQLNPVDLAILRLSVYELTNLDTPRPVVINEALELTKKYSTMESKNFVHSVLSKVCEELDGTNN